MDGASARPARPRAGSNCRGTVVFGLLQLLAPSVARVRPSELQALWHLYENGGGANWRDNEHWDLSKDPCRMLRARVPYRGAAAEDWSAVPMHSNTWYEATPWYGVGCIDPCDDYLDGDMCTAGRIVSLRLRANNLVGDASGWIGIGSLRNFTHLDLSYNSLAGSLPTHIGQINNLEVLQLRDNSLGGALPSELGALNANGVGELREISLANNSFEGVLPPTLAAHAQTLMSFDVGQNLRISGTVPASYASLPALQVLYLRNNSLSGTLPGLGGGGSGGTSQLRYLELQGNAGFSGTLPSELGGLTDLFTFDAQGLKISGTLPSELGQLNSLTFLRLNDNLLSGSLPTELGNLNRLENLDLYNNALEGDMPSELGRLINLRLMYLPNEQLLPLRLRYCQHRLPNLGKYSYRLVREEYYKMASSICPEPYDTLSAFGTMAQLSGDV